MARKKKCKDKGVLEYVSVKNKKTVKAIIRELGLELVKVTSFPSHRDDMANKIWQINGKED